MQFPGRSQCCHPDSSCCGLQVLTIHSPFRVENLTNQQLEFHVHLFRGPQNLAAPSKGAAAISVVPLNPLPPGQWTYLPVPAIWWGPLSALHQECSLEAWPHTHSRRTCLFAPPVLTPTSSVTDHLHRPTQTSHATPPEKEYTSAVLKACRHVDNCMADAASLFG